MASVPESVYNLCAFLMGGMILFLPYGFRCAGEPPAGFLSPLYAGSPIS